MLSSFDKNNTAFPDKPVTKPKFNRHGLTNKDGDNLRNALRYGKIIHNAELISKKGFFAVKPFQITLFDISSSGVRFASERKQKINTSLILRITFSSGKSFEISGKVVRKDFMDDNCYGFRFDTYHAELGDYLFRTQTHPVLIERLVNDY